MKLRRSLTATAALAVVVGSILIGSAAPASASTLVLPTCAHAFDDPSSYWSDFASINHAQGVAYHPSFALYGSDNAALRTEIIVWRGTTCSWRLSTSASRNFTISETPLNSFRAAWLRNWYSTHGIVGENDIPTLGGYAYQVNAHELDVLWHNKVWIAITSRGTSVEGFTMQSAGYTLSDLNPWVTP